MNKIDINKPVESKKYALDTLASFLSNFVIRGIQGLLLIPLITKLTGASNYGIWIQISVIVSFALHLTNLGLQRAFWRFSVGLQDKAVIGARLSTVVATQLCTTVILFIILTANSGLIATYLFGASQNAIYVRLAAIIIILQQLQFTFITYFNTFRQFTIYNLLKILEPSLLFLLVGLALYFNFAIFGAVLAQILTLIILTGISLIIFARQIGFNYPKLFYLKEMLKYGIPTIPLGAFVWVTQLSDRAVISLYHGTKYVGIYGLADSIAYMSSIAFFSLSITMPSTVGKLWEDRDFDRVKKYLINTIVVGSLVSIPLIFGLVYLAKPAILLLSSSEFLLAISVIPISALAWYCYHFSIPFDNLIFLHKKPIVYTLIYLVAAIINIVLNFLLIPRYGIIGAAVSTLVAYFIQPLAGIIYTRSFFKFSIPWLKLAKIAIAGSGMFLFLNYVFPLPKPNWFISIIVIFGTMIYAGGLFILGVLNKSQIDAALKLIIQEKR